MTDDTSDDGTIKMMPKRLRDWIRENFHETDDSDEDSTETDGGTPGDEAEDSKDELLLTNEERILRELKSSGRTEQSELVSRMGWSKVKTSRVLCEMEEAGQVSRIQIGREKVVALPHQQFEAAGSPFDTDDRQSELAKQ